MNYKLAWLGALAGLGCLSNGQSLVGSFTWSGNGHVYEAWNAANGISYQDAAAFSVTRGGTLATITSDGERDAVLANLGAVLPSTAYLGAQQASTETDPTVGWAWVTGEAWSYTNWNAGEPNDFNGSASEQNLEMYPTGLWNDIGDNSSGFNTGLLVEIVPEPSSSVGLLALGGLFFARRKRA